MATWSPSISAYEVPGTAVESADLESVSATVQLNCAYTDRHALVADLLVNRRAWPKGDPGNTPLAASASIALLLEQYTTDSNDELVVPTRALVTVNYTTLPILDTVVDSLEPTAEFQILDHRGFRWGAADGDPLEENEAPGRLIRGLNYVRTINSEASAPPASVLTLVGYCNSDSVVSSLLGYTFTAETLLYNPPTLSTTYRSDGTQVYSRTMKFTYKPEGWNKYYRQSTQSYANIYEAGGSVFNSYPSAAFAGIL